MKVTFVGVGEACDQNCPNTSIFVESAEDKSLLLDCGFTVPHQYFSLENDPDALSALWVSHFHGDHFFGVPLLLLRFEEMGRKKPLCILGPEGINEKICLTMEMAYPKFLEKLSFSLRFCELHEGEERREAGHLWKAAAVQHSGHALAVKISGTASSLFYSGDGRATKESSNLAENCDLIVHEAFRLNGDTPGHGNVYSCLDLARKTKAKKLALVHICRTEREVVKNALAELQLSIGQIQVLVPEAGDEIKV